MFLCRQMEVLKAKFESGHFPPKILITLDNTAKENKNNFFHNFWGILFLAWMPHLEMIVLKYNRKGHTHTGVDAIIHQLGAIIRTLFLQDRHLGLWILRDIIKMMKDSRINGDAVVAKNLPAVAAWLEWVCVAARLFIQVSLPCALFHF